MYTTCSEESSVSVSRLPDPEDQILSLVPTQFETIFFSFHHNHGLHTVERTVHRILYSVVSRLGAALVPVKTDI